MDDLNLPSGRSLDEVLDHSYARAEGMRRRRRLTFIGAPLTALAVIAGAAAMASSGGSPTGVTAADSTADSTTTTEAQPEGDTTTTTAAGEQPGTGPSPTSTSTSTTATRPGSPPTSTTSTTANGGAPRLEECSPSALRLEVTTDRDRYRIAETVSVHAVIRNIGAVPCRTPHPMGYAIVDETGQSLFEVAWVEGQPAGGSEPAQRFDPGDEQTYDFTWDQNECEPGPAVAQCRRAETGRYAARMHWGPPTLSADSPQFVLE